MLTGYYRPTSGEVRVFGRSPDEFSGAEREKLEILEFVELDQERGKLARRLSGGMQRR